MTDKDDSEKKREARSEAEAEDDRQASRQKQRKQQKQQQHQQQQDSQQGGVSPTAALDSALDTVILDLAAAIHHLQETGDIEVGGARVEGLSGVLDEAAANGADLEKIARNIQT